jgi:H+/Cl- antiporter ClcA
MASTRRRFARGKAADGAGLAVPQFRSYWKTHEIQTQEAALIQDWRRQLVFFSGAICVGLVAILFALGCEQANKVFHDIVAISPYLPLIVTPAGLAFVVLLTRKVFPGSQGSGIPQTIAALEPGFSENRSKLLSLRIAVGKVFLTMLGLMFGSSVGREGPTVQIGASIMHSMNRFATFSKHDIDRGLILAGGAAGVAAAFNTPLAGIVFAIEEMGRSFDQHNSSTILLTVIIAGIASLAFLGNYSYFGHTSETLAFGTQWDVVIVCGIAGGLVGGAFSRSLIEVNKGLSGTIGVVMKERPVLTAAGCGLILALLGLASSNMIYGSGYAEAKQILSGTDTLPESYGLLKMAATLVSYVSGIPGGIMAPSLSTGAGFGANIAHFMPAVPAGAAVTLGMVAYFAGATQVPITAFVIVMEMTDNHEMILPLMAASFIASACSKLICPSSLFHTLSGNFTHKQHMPAE